VFVRVAGARKISVVPRAKRSRFLASLGMTDYYSTWNIETTRLAGCTVAGRARTQQEPSPICHTQMRGVGHPTLQYSFLQGLKPCLPSSSTQGLKPLPPEEKTKSSCATKSAGVKSSAANPREKHGSKDPPLQERRVTGFPTKSAGTQTPRKTLHYKRSRRSLSNLAFSRAYSSSEIVPA